MTEPVLKDKKLAQVAIVVRDIESARHRWAAVLGVEAPPIIEVERGGLARATYRGEPTDDAVKLAFFDLGGVQLELLEPIGTENAWAEGLAEHGDRLHHLAFWVDDMKVAVHGLATHGVSIMQRGDMGEGQYVYADGMSQLGTVLELLEAKRTDRD